MDYNIAVKNNLDSVQLDLLSKLLASLNNEQKIWLGGYLSGINESTSSLLGLLSKEVLQTGAKQDNHTPNLKILYGTRSGNSQKLAQKALKKANELGIKAHVVNLNDYNPKELKKEQNVLIVVSTDGEGEPPVSVEEFYEYIHSRKAPKLGDLKYAVLALGDSSYQHFCKTGRDIDEKLTGLGAQRFFDRVDCDLDFEENATNWIKGSLDKFAEENQQTAQNINVGDTLDAVATNAYTQENPFNAPLLDKILLNGRGSSKETYHYEFSIEGSGIAYSPGDSLGVYSSNDSKYVEEVLKLTNIDENDKVIVGKQEKTVRHALTHSFELTRLTPLLVKAYAEITQSKKLLNIIADKNKAEEYYYGRDLIDLLQEYPTKLDSKTLFSILRKLQPRLYSIASSYNANPDEVHITVSSVKYQRNKRNRFGVCSTFLSDRIDEDSVKIPIYIDENIGFRLPNDTSSPIVMIGAGTGVAPYRAFLQERSLNSGAGKSWLFFGERNFTTDFIYQTEWQKLYKSKQLTKIDLAFSRDQKDKIYVQHKLLEQKKELFRWIEEGAYIYLCGDKNNMAKDVKDALLKVIELGGGFKPDKAAEYFKQLRKESRFQEDVY